MHITIEVLRAIGAVLFLVEFVAFAVIGYLKFEERYRALSEVLYDSLIVVGLNMLGYAYLGDGGDLQWTWLIYSLSCVYLAVSFYRLLTYNPVDELKRVKNAGRPNVAADRDFEAERSYEYMIMKACVFLTLIAGLPIHLVASDAWRWAIYFAAFVPFVFAALYHFRAVTMRNQGDTVSKYWIRVVVYGTMLFWLGYPIVMLLGPLFLGMISGASVIVGYILLDVITKHLFTALSVYYMYSEAPEEDGTPVRRRGAGGRYTSV